MEIKTFSPSSHKIKAVVYGASGSGKTHFAATAPKPIFASAEAGLLSTIGVSDKIDYVEIKTMQDLADLRNYLTTKPHKYETVVIDSITEINDIIKSSIEATKHRDMQLQDWGTLAKKIKNILREFRDMDMHVIFIAQEAPGEKDAEGNTLKMVPSLNGKSATDIAYYMDIVGYAYVDKAGNHQVMTASNARLLTKDRSGKVGNDAPPNFSEWVKRVGEIAVKKEETHIVDPLPTDDLPDKEWGKKES